MKKVLSLVLAFAMILGSFGFVFASDFSDVKDTEYYSEAVNVLSGFGVIAGFPDGTFKPTENVTRAQMAAMITAALGIPVKGSGATGFSDVPASHWASGYIAYAVSVGFVAGYPDKTFKPENPVSYNEALTMIVAALGYTAESLPGTWPGAFVNKARGLGILDTCSTTGNAAAPRADIACFLYDSLDQSIGYVDKDGVFQRNVGKDKVVGHDTMLERLGATEYNDGLAFVVTGEEDSAINLNNYLGAFITAYQNADEEIVAIKEVKSEFIEGAYKSSNQTVDSKKFAEAKKLLEPATDKEKEEWTGAYVGFKNGEKNAAVTDWTYEADSVKVAVKLSGSKVVTVYSVQVWDAKDEFYADEDVQETITDDHKIGSYALPEDDNDEIAVNDFALVGVSSLSEIAENDVVTVYMDAKDKVVKKVEVSNKTAEGIITEINKDKEAIIGGTAYARSEFAEVTDADLNDAMKAETEAKFYLNYAGAIFDFEEAEETTTNYAILLDRGSEGGTFDTNTGKKLIKLFLADGTTKDFEAEEAIYTAAKDKQGAVVKYTIDSDNIIVEMKYEDGNAANAEFDGNGIYNKMATKDNTVVFAYSGTEGDPKEEAKADNYEVLKSDALFDTKVDSIYWIVSNGDLKAVKATGLSGGSSEYAIFIEAGSAKKAGTVYTTLYEGDVKGLVVTSDAAAKVVLFTTVPSISLAKLTFDADGNVKDIDNTTYPAPVETITAKLVDKDGKVVKTAATATTFTDAAGDNYSLASDVRVYVYSEEDEEWTKGTTSSMAGKNFKGIYLYDTSKSADKEYDIVIVVK